MSNRNKRETGFTLLEVVLVTALLALVGFFAIGNFRNYGKSVEIDLTGKNVIQDLRQMRARAAAGEDRRNWGAHFVNGSQDYYELFSTPTTYSDGSKTITTTIYLPGAVQFSVPAESSTLDIIFSSIAGTTAANAMTIVSEGTTKTVSVTASGAVY